jgi:hypothetical protein
MHHVFQAQSSAPEAKVSLARMGQFLRARTADGAPDQMAPHAAIGS